MPITVFTRSVSGYNRHEVDEYIADMNRAFVKSKRDYEKKIEILEAENTKLRDELKKAAEEAANAPVVVSTEPEPIPVETPVAVPAPAINDDIAEKSRRYDEISLQVGEILMNANAEASMKIREADEKVRTALTGTMSTLRGEVTSLITKLTELLESAEAELSVDDAVADGDIFGGSGDAV